jgi:hypothetical protein
LTKGTNQGGAPAKRIAILCMSVAVVALLLAASALPVFAVSKKSSDTTNGDTTSGGTVSPDATNKTSSTTDGDKLTNAVKSPSPVDHVAITLTEDSRHALAGSANGVQDQLPSGFTVTSIKAPKFDCTGEGTDLVSCNRKNQSEFITYKVATIKIVAMAPSVADYTNEADDTYSNTTSTLFEVR